VQAIPAKTLKEVAEIWERAAAPKDSKSCGYVIMKKPTLPHVSPHSTIPMKD
jgi:hypothetical protein